MLPWRVLPEGEWWETAGAGSERKIFRFGARTALPCGYASPPPAHLISSMSELGCVVGTLPLLPPYLLPGSRQRLAAQVTSERELFILHEL